MVDSVTLVRTTYEAFAQGDMARVTSVMDDRIEWYEAEHTPYSAGCPFVGPQAIIEGVFARIPQEIDGFRVDVERVIGQGDTVVSEVRYHGTGRRTGKPLNAQVVHVWDLRDGKVVRWRQYADTWQIVDVTGLPPGA